MYVIFGATGKVGRATVEALLEEGAAVRAVLREPAKARDFERMGCDVAVADLRDPPSMAGAMVGAEAIQVICPAAPQSEDAMATMLHSLEAIASAIKVSRPPLVLAISDYGAHLSCDTGVTRLFHAMEQRLAKAATSLILLRSAEHMENWGRLIKIVASTGVLHSMHHPLTKLFPTVSAGDIGRMSARLLLKERPAAHAPVVVHGEGPRRYSPLEIAAAMATLLGREVVAHELPRERWQETLRAAGLSESYGALIARLYDVHNAGLIDAADDPEQILYGTTDIVAALEHLLSERWSHRNN
jgi:uncharacterized protein YbjT (DUF2867 family)